VAGSLFLGVSLGVLADGPRWNIFACPDLCKRCLGDKFRANDASKVREKNHLLLEDFAMRYSSNLTCLLVWTQIFRKTEQASPIHRSPQMKTIPFATIFFSLLGLLLSTVEGIEPPAPPLDINWNNESLDREAPLPSSFSKIAKAVTPSVVRLTIARDEP
jgi:hypothetical protein